MEDSDSHELPCLHRGDLEVAATARRDCDRELHLAVALDVGALSNDLELPTDLPPVRVAVPPSRGT